MPVTSRDKKMRVYHLHDSCIFKKNNEPFGELSNMATIFPLKINGHEIKTSEALYQSCKYPFNPEVQREICLVKSPMTAKMIGRTHSRKMRTDWNEVKVKIMKWCLKIKIAQHFITFGEALIQTNGKNIVENSSKDNFWGAIPNEDKTEFIGINALGRLLMELREDINTNNVNSLLVVKPPANVENFYLFGEKVIVQDERESFITNFLSYLNMNKKYDSIDLNIFGAILLNAIHHRSDFIAREKQTTGRNRSKVKKEKIQTIINF